MISQAIKLYFHVIWWQCKVSPCQAHIPKYLSKHVRQVFEGLQAFERLYEWECWVIICAVSCTNLKTVTCRKKKKKSFSQVSTSIFETSIMFTRNYQFVAKTLNILEQSVVKRRVYKASCVHFVSPLVFQNTRISVFACEYS